MLDGDIEQPRTSSTEKVIQDRNSNTLYDWEHMRQKEQEVSRKEERKVVRMRIFLALVLVVSTVVCAFGVHRFVRHSERTDFRIHYDHAARKVLDTVGKTIDTTMGATDSMAVSMASFAAHMNLQWPYVTMPSFYLNTKKIHDLSKSVWTTVYHVVTHEQREAWQNYTKYNNHWIDEDLAVESTDETFSGPIINEYENFDVIHGWDEYDKDEPGKVGTDPRDFYLVNWQNAPVIPRYPVYNWDLLSQVYNDSITSVMQTQKAVITEAYMLPDPNNPDEVAEAQATADWFADYVGPGEDPNEPVSDIYYPIYDDVSRVTLTDQQRQSFVAVMANSIYWRDMLKDIFVTGEVSHSLVVVFENACTVSFTYHLNGQDLEYLGRGDRHDKRFDDMEIASTIGQLSSLGRHYTGVPINHDYCPFTIRVFPAREMEQAYVTNKPEVLTAVAVLIFIFTAVVFLVYDYAASSNASTLGRLVKQRTRALEESNDRLEKANRKILQASAAQLRHFACMSHEIRCVPSLCHATVDCFGDFVLSDSWLRCGCDNTSI